MTKCASVLVLFFALVTIVSSTSAEVPRLIDYQGVLTDDAGLPVDAQHQVTFRIYATADVGAPILWEENHPTVTVEKGLFHVILGSVTPFPADLFADAERWLGIALNGGAEMTNRSRLTATPWALRAAVAESVVGGGGGDGHSLDASDGSPTDAVFVDPVGNVGIGTTSPTEQLTVRGKVQVNSISGTGGGELVLKSSTFNEPGRYRIRFANNQVAPFTGDDVGEQWFNFMSVWGPVRQYDAHLQVFGRATNSWGHALELTHDGTDGKILTDTGDIILDPAANVGVNTANPTASLHVTGDLKVEGGNAIVPVLQITGGADLSEQFNVHKSSVSDVEPQPGMVVRIDERKPGQLVLSHVAYDRRVAGILSGAGGVAPGMLMAHEGTVASGSEPVALTGRVYCWVDASSGPVTAGDLLTTSDTPGHAMKVIDHDRARGAVLGKAMSSLHSGRGLVLVLVTLQ